jgi:hypothetical protein
MMLRKTVNKMSIVNEIEEFRSAPIAAGAVSGPSNNYMSNNLSHTKKMRDEWLDAKSCRLHPFYYTPFYHPFPRPWSGPDDMSDDEQQTNQLHTTSRPFRPFPVMLASVTNHEGSEVEKRTKTSEKAVARKSSVVNTSISRPDKRKTKRNSDEVIDIDLPFQSFKKTEFPRSNTGCRCKNTRYVVVLTRRYLLCFDRRKAS